MKVLFIYSLDDYRSVKTPIGPSSIQFGISYISSILKAHGHETQLLILGSHHWKEDMRLLRTSCEEFAPRLVCFTAVNSQYPFIQKIAGFTKSRWPDKYIMIGGVYATLRPDDVIAGPFDSICVGEGELPTVELCGHLEYQDEPHGIANLWIKSRNGHIERNDPRDFLQDLDSLPFPDREIWKPWIKAEVDGGLSMLLGRGCPYDCTYCSNHALRKVARGKYVRMRSPENILREVAFLCKSYPYRRMFLEVETISLNKAWVIELCSQLAAFNSTMPHPVSYGCNFRVSRQSMDEDLFIALEKANFRSINIGLESGSARIRRALKRDYSNADFLKTVSLARKHGLKVNVYNMIGLPGESLGDHKRTIVLNRQCKPDIHHTGIFYPYAGTELYKTCIEQGLMREAPHTRMERRQPVINLPNFSKAQVKRAFTWFDYNVYKGRRPLLALLIQVVIVKIGSNPTTNFLFPKIVRLPVLRPLRALLSRKLRKPWWSS